MKRLNVFEMLKHLVRDILVVTVPLAVSYHIYQESLQKATMCAFLLTIVFSLAASLIFSRKSCLYDGNLRISYLKEADRMNYLLEIHTPLDELETQEDVRLKVVNDISQG